MKLFSKLLICGIGLMLATAVPKFAHAQSGATDTLASATPLNNPAGLDTVSNAGTKVQSIAIPSYWDLVTFQCDVTAISGTVGGTLTLMGSTHGTKYVQIGSPITVGTASKSYSFSVNPSTFAYYEVVYTGTGTMSASIQSFALWRRAISQPVQY